MSLHKKTYVGPRLLSRAGQAVAGETPRDVRHRTAPSALTNAAGITAFEVNR